MLMSGWMGEQFASLKYYSPPNIFWINITGYRIDTDCIIVGDEVVMAM